MDQHTEAGSAEAGPAQAHFVLRREAVIGGVTVPVELGAHSWGRLSPARDNAVLVCHYYTGTMRAEGAGPDGTPGWWDALIGTGRATCPDFPERVAHGVQGRTWADRWRREDEKREGCRCCRG